ncbi:MAG: terminase small subunit [Synechococcus sp.]
MEEFPLDFNGAQAAIRAGYAPGSAKVTAARLLANANVGAALSKEWAAIRERNKVSIDSIISELTAIAFSRITDVVSWDNNGIVVKSSSELSQESAIAVQRVTMRETETADGTVRVVEVKLHDKLAALEKLCRHRGFYKTQPEQVPLKIQIVEAVPDFVDEDEDAVLN